MFGLMSVSGFACFAVVAQNMYLHKSQALSFLYEARLGLVRDELPLPHSNDLPAWTRSVNPNKR